MARDRYQYFRVEAREILEGLTAGLLALERGDEPRSVVPHLLRLAHTLKGAASVVGQRAISVSAHALEDKLAPFRADNGGLPGEIAHAALALVDEIAAAVSALAAPPAPAPEPQERGGARAEQPPAPEAGFETLRVDVHLLDETLRALNECAVGLSSLRRELDRTTAVRDLSRLLCELLEPRRLELSGKDALVRAQAVAEELKRNAEFLARRATTDLEQLDLALHEATEVAERSRLASLSVVRQALERAVRDAARAEKKAVSLSVVGDDVRLEGAVVFALRTVLVQLVRNAIAHGIEGEAARQAAGKPATGRISVSWSRSARHVVVRCEDDGQGVDTDQVRKTALERGVLDAQSARALSDAEACALLLSGRFSTKAGVSELAGRGVGLDLVREEVAKLRGEVVLRSERGKGTTVEVRVPVSLVSVHVLLCEAGAETVAIPLDAVERAVRLEPRQVASSGRGVAFMDGPRALPLASLKDLLRLWSPTRDGARDGAVLIVRHRDERAALSVRRLLGSAVVVTRPIPETARAEPSVAAACLDTEGNPRLVIDPAGVIAAARSVTTTPAAPAERPPPVLVIDDSLTTRMLEQSILESAGYEVDVAASAEDGLALAEKRRYGVFIVDVEMPGMDGFEFVARTRAHPVLSAVPAILVTSRAAAEDRRRGEEVGAHAYMVKGEFDQGRLLQTVRQLIGAPA